MPPAPGGLTLEEARVRLRRFGPNASPAAADRTVRHVLASVAGEPMFLLLLAAAALYLAIGDLAEGLPRRNRSGPARAFAA